MLYRINPISAEDIKKIREAILSKKNAVFLNIVQKAFDSPPFRLNIMW